MKHRIVNLNSLSFTDISFCRPHKAVSLSCLHCEKEFLFHNFGTLCNRKLLGTIHASTSDLQMFLAVSRSHFDNSSFKSLELHSHVQTEFYSATKSSMKPHKNGAVFCLGTSLTYKAMVINLIKATMNFTSYISLLFQTTSLCRPLCFNIFMGFLVLS